MAIANLSRSVSGRAAFITGAASGIGRAAAHVFAAEGVRLGLTRALAAASYITGAVIPVDGGLTARNA